MGLESAEQVSLMESEAIPTLGVVIVTYGSEDVIGECLETLAASTGAALKIVIVDNASKDGSCEAVINWASGAAPYVRPANSPLPKSEPVSKPLPLAQMQADEPVAALGPLTLIRSNMNLGFAGGVNVGLRALAGQADWFWVLNPDCAVPPDTARGYIEAAQANPNFSLMSSRTIYYDHPELIQSDGGWVDRATGVCHQRNQKASVTSAVAPPASELDWLTGANIVASPAFLARAGLMPEDYFLYYEEVDWAFRRGDMPLALAPGVVVYHHGGTSVGSGTIGRRSSPFSDYLGHRNRMRFTRRFLSQWSVGAYAYGFAKAVQLMLQGAPAQAYASLAGTLELAPPRNVRDRFSDPAVARLAFGRDKS
jgi:hypothetical protein